MAGKEFDVVVIGGGPGGYVAAIRAAQLGLKAVCIEREHLGGICLNWGCIPTKALLRSAEIYHNMKNAKEYGLSCDNPTFDLAAIVKRSRGVSAQMNAGIGFLLKKNKVTHIEGSAKLDGNGKVLVTGKDGKVSEIIGKDIIVATGARARELPHLKADGKLIWTYKHALTPDVVPDKLLVIGSGAIGIEFASFFNELGSKVTVVEMLDRVLPVEDKDVSEFAAKSFKKQGMTIKTKAGVTELKVSGGKVTATIEEGGKKSTDTFDRVILAIGITGNVEELGLEKAGVKVDRGHIVTDKWCATDAKGIWAIGDVAGAPWLAHKASHEGVIVAEKIAGEKDVHPLDKSNIAGCTYCRPQVASVGMTEQAAIDAGHSVRVGKFPFAGNGKAVALGEPEGFVKTVFDKKTGELLGAHMVGAEVTELIQGYVVARSLESTEIELIHTVFPHPTLSEMMHESVLDAYDKAIHI